MGKEKKRKVTGPDKEGLVYFEIWGMLLIITSFILLSELGSVGTLLNKFVRLLFGDYYWLTLIFVIYYGLMMIIKHQFISYSSLRIKGIVCLSLGILMFSHFPVYHYVAPQLNDSNSNLVALSYNVYMGYLENNNMSATFGGGIIGAAALTIVLMLIGEIGAYIVASLLLAAGIAFLFEKTIYDFIKDIFVNTKDFSGKFTKKATDIVSRMQSISKENKRFTKDEFIEADSMEIGEEMPAESFYTIKSDQIPFEHKPTFEMPNIKQLTYYNNQKVLENQKEITLEQAKKIKKYMRDNFTELTISEIYIGPTISTYIIPIRTLTLKNTFLQHQNEIIALLREPNTRIIIDNGQVARIEVPNQSVYTVSLREVMDEQDRSGLMIGRDYRGEFYRVPFTNGFNLLIMGNDINSKIELLKSLILQIIYTYTPDEMDIALFDSTKFELNEFGSLPHLFNGVFIDQLSSARRQIQSLYTKLEYRINRHEDDMKPILIIWNDFTDFYREGDDRDLMSDIIRYGPAVNIFTICATSNLDETILTPQLRSLFETTVSFKINNKELSKKLFDIETDLLLKNGDCIINDKQSRQFIRVQAVRLKAADYIFKR